MLVLESLELVDFPVVEQLDGEVRHGDPLPEEGGQVRPQPVPVLQECFDVLVACRVFDGDDAPCISVYYRLLGFQPASSCLRVRVGSSRVLMALFLTQVLHVRVYHQLSDLRRVLVRNVHVLDEVVGYGELQRVMVDAELVTVADQVAQHDSGVSSLHIVWGRARLHSLRLAVLDLVPELAGALFLGRDPILRPAVRRGGRLDSRVGDTSRLHEAVLSAPASAPVELCPGLLRMLTLLRVARCAEGVAWGALRAVVDLVHDCGVASGLERVGCLRVVAVLDRLLVWVGR